MKHSRRGRDCFIFQAAESFCLPKGPMRVSVTSSEVFRLGPLIPRRGRSFIYPISKASKPALGLIQPSLP